MRRFAQFLALALWCAGACAMIGCGSGGPPTATVSGVVKLHGKELAEGSVTFVAPDGRTGSSAIKPDGTYAVTDAPVGKAVVLVTAPPPSTLGTLMPGGTKARPSVAIPKKYGDKTTSDLKHEVTAGKETFDIDLK